MSPTLGVVIIALGQAPNAMQMIRQYHDGNDLEGPMFFSLRKGDPKQIDMLHQ